MSARVLASSALVLSLVLAGCSGSPEDPDGGDSRTSASPTATPGASATAEIDVAPSPHAGATTGADVGDDTGGTDAGDSDSTTGDSGDDPAPAMDIDEIVIDDPYCGPAFAGYEAQFALFEATDAKSSITGEKGSVSAMNGFGEDMLTAMADVSAEWSDARSQMSEGDYSGGAVGDDAADQAFADFLTYLEVYAQPEAELAAESGSIDEYALGVLALLAAPGVTEAATEGAAAVGIVLEYTIQRCGMLPELG